MKQPPALLNVVNWPELSALQQQEVFTKIGLAALKFFILKVQPKKRMTFDPKESLDMQGQTGGPYIQNAFVRIQSIFRKGGVFEFNPSLKPTALEESEKSLMVLLTSFPGVIAEAARVYDPHTLPTIVIPWPKNFIDFITKLEFWGCNP